MRCERLKDIVKLAIRMQGLRGGVTLDEIQAEFAVGRRTAERMRDAVEWAFGPLEIAESGDNKRHWRLRSDALRRLAPPSAEELAELESAAESLERTGFEARAAALRELDTKLRAAQRTDSLARIEADIEALVQAEGLAMRPGPRPSLDRDLLARLREAITTCRIVEVRYLSQSTGRHSRQRIEPYGLLYGNRAFLVGRTDWNDAMRLWRLGNMSEAHVTRRGLHARAPDFDLESLRPPLLRHLPGEAGGRGAVLHGQRPSATHPPSSSTRARSMEENADGTLTVRFTAGGIDEICWHLVTWGGSVTVEDPARLRQRLVTMCSALAAHYRTP